MRSEEIFNDIDDKTAERLSKEYPVLNDEQKERLYAMSKRKFDINNENDNKSMDVSGVEKYRRPKWYKGASVAAAALLLVSGIGGSMYYISRNGKAPAAEVEDSISETTEVTTEALTEEQTEAVDAEAVARELIDAYREYICFIYGGNLEVDKSDITTRTVKLHENDIEFEREFYRVTDERYPTWADLKDRCYEIFDNELGQKILEICTGESEEVVNGNPFICVTEDGYYHEVGIHDNPIDPLDISDYDMNAYTDENGDIIAKVTETELREVHDYPIPETTFTIVNTEKGWRISDVTEKPLDEENEDSTEAE